MRASASCSIFGFFLRKFVRSGVNGGVDFITESDDFWLILLFCFSAMLLTFPLVKLNVELLFIFFFHLLLTCCCSPPVTIITTSFSCMSNVGGLGVIVVKTVAMLLGKTEK